MEKRVRVFTEKNPYFMMSSMNKFLRETHGKLHDVLYDVVQDTKTGVMEYSSLVVYTPEGVENATQEG